MKRIIVVRHATAVSRSAGVEDFDRKLRKKGRREAAEMGRWLSGALDEPPLLVSSPARRALATARAFAKELGVGKARIIKSKEFYDEGSAQALLDVLRGLPDADDAVAVFGHEPTLGELVGVLVPGFEDSLEKCQVVGLDIRRKKWSTLKPGDGEVAFLESPGAIRGRRKAARAARSYVAQRLEEGVRAALADLGVSPEDEDPTIRRASRRLARQFAEAARVPSEVLTAEAGEKQ